MRIAIEVVEVLHGAQAAVVRREAGAAVSLVMADPVVSGLRCPGVALDDGKAVLVDVPIPGLGLRLPATATTAAAATASTRTHGAATATSAVLSLQ
jgi:hypothetical protein